MTYKKGALQKVEKQFAEKGFKLRYEKGNFKAGYCLVRDSKVIIINKFYNNKARYNCLMEIMETNGFADQLNEEEGTVPVGETLQTTELITP